MQRASPIDPAYAALALEGATDRDKIFELVLRAVRSQTRFAALLMVHPEHLRGQRAISDPRYDASRVESLTVLRHTVPAFETAITSSTPSVGSIATGEPFVDGLLELLGGRARTAVVLPIAVDGRTCALVVGHRGSTTFTAEDVSELLPLAAASTAALDRLRQVRVRAATVPRQATRHDTSAEIEISFESLGRRRSTLSELRSNEAWADLADGIRDLVLAGMKHGEPGEDEQRELLLELGHLEADHLGRVDAAIEAWRSALAIDARDERVLDALDQTFTRQGRWHELAQLLEQRIALADDVEVRVARLLELAAISHERLGDGDGALAAYERVLDVQPDHPAAMRELQALYTRNNQWEAIAALLLDRAASTGDPGDRVAALETVARMYEDKGGDRHGAFLVWAAMLRSVPERSDIIDQLARLGGTAGADAIAEGSAVAEELETTHPQTSARIWHLVGTWARDLRPTDATAALTRAYTLESDPARRAEICIELATLYESMGGSPGDAIIAYERALDSEPESIRALTALHDLYRRTEAWEELANLLPRRIAISDAPAAGLVEMWVELGNVLADRLQRYDDALSAFTTARGLAPTNRAALQGCARVYQATGRTEELLAAKESELDAADGAERTGAVAGKEPQRDATAGARRAAAYAELATAWEDRGRPDRAAACRRKQLALGPADLAAHEGLVRALRLDEQWTALADAIAALLPLAAPSDRLVLLLELADIRDIRQGDVDGAIAAYNGVLSLDKNHPVALDRLAVLHDRAGHFPAALEILGRQLAAETTPRARADLLQRMGHVCLNARNFVKAREHLEQALVLDLSNAGAHEGMGWLHVHEQSLPSAGNDLVRAAQLSDDRHDRVRRYLDAAWLYWHRLRDAERARTCLNAILAIEPDHADAKHALTELLADQHEWEALWPRLELEVQRSGDDTAIPASTRAELFTRAARCALELDRFDKADALFDRACSLDSSPALQLERAEALHRGRSLEAAATAYQALLQTEGAPVERGLRVRIYRKLAEIETALGRHGQAHKYHQEVLALEPEHVDTLRDLVELDLARGQFDDAVAHLKLLAQSATSTDARVSYFERIGDIYRERLHNAPRAISTYLDALELARGNRRLLQRVLDVQTETGQWRAAVDTIARFIETETEPAKRASYHLAAAEIRRSELRDRAGALAAYERALDDLYREQPLSDASRRRGLDTFLIIDTLMTQDGDWRALEHAYVRMIKRLPKTDLALVALWHALGELYRTHIGNDDHALAAFEVAHSLDPHPSTLRARILAELRAKLAPPAPPEPAPMVADAATSRDPASSRGPTSTREGPPRPPPKPSAPVPPRAATPLLRPDALPRFETPVPSETPVPRRPLRASSISDGHRGASTPMPRLDTLPRFDTPAPSETPVPLRSSRASSTSDRHRPAAIASASSSAVTPERATSDGPPERPSAPLGRDVAETYREIGRSSLAAGHIDQAWCVARTLVLTRRATEDERAFYMHYRPVERREATGMLDDDAWAYIRHPDEDRTISNIFAQTWQAAALQKAQPTEAFELSPKQRVPVEDGGRLIARICRYAAGVLDVALPEVYIQPQRAGRLMLANRVERGRLLPSVIVCRDMLSGYREPEITTELAALIAQLRPAYHLNLALSSVDELEAALGAAASLVGRTDIGAHAPELRSAIAADLQQRLLSPQLNLLRNLVARLPERPDLAGWRRAIDATSQRAALLVCGELVATARMIATDPNVTDPEAAGRRVEDLIAYSVSPKYFAARAQLGVTVV